MESQKNIRDVIASWQTKLLQLDRRNSLLYFRGQRSSVGIVETSPDELLERLQKSRSGLKLPYAEPRRRVANLFEAEREDGALVVPGDLETDIAPLALQRRLLNLHRQDREWEEEQGVNVLYVVLGFLNWVDEDGETARAPLLLVPADLERDSPRDPWRLKLEDDDLQINETLRYQISTLGAELPEHNHDLPSAYLREVTQRLAHKKGWSVEPALALATFPFAKMAMWEDLEEMRRQGTEHPVIQALAGKPEILLSSQSKASVRLPADAELQGGGLDDLLPVKEQFAVLPTDHTQLRAIESARCGGHLVVHGPPGTGKSQTIANIIATFLADGKRVLFVSEKTAALDVVKKRLEDCELGCFCLDLHSHRARKASVYQQMREALATSRFAADTFPLEKLEEQRQRLNTVARALHERRGPLGLSVFEAQGRFARIRSLQRIDFPIRNIESFSSSMLDDVQEAAARIARRKAEFEAHRTSPWRSLRRSDVSIELADELRQIVSTMRGAVTAFQAQGDAESQALGLPVPEDPSAIYRMERVAGHMASCPGVPESWLWRYTLPRLESRAKNLATMQSDRHELEEKLAPFFGGELPAVDFQELKGQLSVSFRDEQRLRESVGSAWKQRLCPLPDACEQELKGAIACTRELLDTAKPMAEGLFDEARLHRLVEVQEMAQRARTALNLDPVPESWFEAGGFSLVRAKLDQARDELAKLEMVERRLFEEFEEGLLDQVSAEMLVRYRTDHQSPWRIFKKPYRADQRALRGCLRSPRKLGVDEALTSVQSALQARDLRKAWEAHSVEYATVLGVFFSGRTTRWDAIAGTVSDIESRIKDWGWSLAAGKRCFSQPGRALIEPLLRDLEAALTKWQSLPLTGQRAESDIDLPVLRNALESGLEIVSRLARDSRGLWPHFRRPLADWAELSDALSWAAQLQRARAQEKELAPALRKDFEGYYDGPESDWQKVQAAIQWVSGLLDLMDDRIPAELARQCRQPHSSEHYVQQRESLARSIESFRIGSAEFSKTFDPLQIGWSDWGSQGFERLLSWLAWIGDNADSAAAWIEYTKAARDLEKLLSPGTVNALREATDDADQVPDLVLRRVYAAWLDHVHEKDSRLRFQPRDHEALREEFRKLDRRFAHANRARIRMRCLRRYPQDGSSAIEGGQLGILHHQLSLKRRQMPVRRLIQQIPQLLQALKPCFLMSPVAVSQYLSRGELAMDHLIFDAVVFDEASQIFPQDAVPAIARARQVIVVGDEKQLPPTSFFRGDATDEDDDEEATDDRLEGVESILDVMVGMKGMGVLSAYLGMHYRSRHEDLIRYSNHYFYDDRLLIFPSPDRASHGLGLKDIYLPNGRYDAGASRTNRAEAEATVDRAFELLRTRPASESVGVVTLSRAQADLIEELINERRLGDSSLDSRFSEDLNERFFVKNLENVQGDERDHIVLSIGYGPTVGSENVPNRFGPINREGGERRLNVAVTRARMSLTLIRSLRPEQIVSEARGSRLLRRFLEYVQDPVRAFEQAIDVDPAAETESPFEEAVYRALTERGHRVSKQVGCFGYRIDLAIAAEDGSRYDLGVECDGATYHRAPAARDRDWLRQSVLEGLGWTVHRVWSTDWIRDPMAQIQSIERALQSARARGREKVALHKPIPQAADFDDAVTANRIQSTAKPKNGEKFSFLPYKVAELPSRRKSVAINEESVQRLCQLITGVVEAEAPIHVDLVVDRIRRHYGAGRAGSQIRSAIVYAIDCALSDQKICYRKIKAERSVRISSFLDMPVHPARPEPRGLAEDGSVRRIEHVWPGEVEAGVLRVVEAAFGIPREDAIVAVARAFGYERAGQNIQEEILAAIDRLIAAGELANGPGGLTSVR